MKEKIDSIGSIVSSLLLASRSFEACLRRRFKSRDKLKPTWKINRGKATRRRVRPTRAISFFSFVRSFVSSLTEFVPWKIDNESHELSSESSSMRFSHPFFCVRPPLTRQRAGDANRLGHDPIVSRHPSAARGSKTKNPVGLAAGNAGRDVRHCRAIYPAFSRAADTLNPFLGGPSTRWASWNRFLLRPFNSTRSGSLLCSLVISLDRTR